MKTVTIIHMGNRPYCDFDDTILQDRDVPLHELEEFCLGFNNLKYIWENSGHAIMRHLNGGTNYISEIIAIILNDPEQTSPTKEALIGRLRERVIEVQDKALIAYEEMGKNVFELRRQRDSLLESLKAENDRLERNIALEEENKKMLARVEAKFEPGKLTESLARAIKDWTKRCHPDKGHIIKNVLDSFMANQRTIEEAGE